MPFASTIDLDHSKLGVNGPWSARALSWMSATISDEELTALRDGIIGPESLSIFSVALGFIDNGLWEILNPRRGSEISNHAESASSTHSRVAIPFTNSPSIPTWGLSLYRNSKITHVGHRVPGSDLRHEASIRLLPGASTGCKRLFEDLPGGNLHILVSAIYLMCGVKLHREHHLQDLGHWLYSMILQPIQDENWVVVRSRFIELQATMDQSLNSSPRVAETEYMASFFELQNEPSLNDMVTGICATLETNRRIPHQDLLSLEGIDDLDWNEIMNSCETLLLTYFDPENNRMALAALYTSKNGSRLAEIISYGTEAQRRDCSNVVARMMGSEKDPRSCRLLGGNLGEMNEATDWKSLEFRKRVKRDTVELCRRTMNSDLIATTLKRDVAAQCLAIFKVEPTASAVLAEVKRWLRTEGGNSEISLATVSELQSQLNELRKSLSSMGSATS